MPAAARSFSTERARSKGPKLPIAARPERQSLTVVDALILFSAGFAGGTVNAVAGGASFFTFPAMLGVGIPPVAANASNATALVPASLVAAWTQRNDLADAGLRKLPALALLSVLAGGAGAVLLLVTSDAAFMVVVPFLLLVATALFAFSPRLLALMRARRPSQGSGLKLDASTVAVLTPCLVYGGYFGAGMGIMLLAGFAVAGLEELRIANALKNGMSALVNGVAVAIFVSQGLVVWPATLAMMAGAALGGFAGARIARRLPQRLFRFIVIAVGSLLTIWYFIKL